MSINLGQKIIDAIENRRDRKRKSQAGSIGDFWRSGGNDLLYSDLPVTTGSLIIDAGAYRGEWSSGMIARYGCQAILFEPVPVFFQQLQAYFKHNSLVKIHNSAVGGKDRQSLFSLLDNGTSEYGNGKTVENFSANVLDIDKVFKQNIDNQRVACMKLNIEGGEYEVLERMIEAKLVTSCDSFLIQFHRQPQGYEKRYKFIVSELEKTHVQKWVYDFVWELWIRHTI
jgi:FkbM family methyltransferase